jgi:hypothetical protein
MRLVLHAVTAAAVPADRSAAEALAAAADHGWVVVIGEDDRPLGVLTRGELAGIDPVERVDGVLLARPVPATLVVEADAEVEDPRLPVVLGSLQGELPRVVVWEEAATARVLGVEELAAAFGVDPAALARAAKGFMEVGPPTGPMLPGPSRIGVIVRQCHFQQPHRGGCGVTRQFERKPRAMPACANPHGLIAHDFAW